MGIYKKWWVYASLSLCIHILILLISKGFWVEPDSAAFADLAKTQSLSYCTPVGYPIFIWVFGLGAKYLFVPVLLQILVRSVVTGLIISHLAQQYSLSDKKVWLLWLVFHIEPQQLYYNTCLMAESLLVSLFLAQWYVWQQYQNTKKSVYLCCLYVLAGLGLYLKPIAVVTLVLLAGYAVWKLKSRYKILVWVLLVYAVFYVSVSSLYYWRYNYFAPDIFKGILFWNNASVITPVLKKEQFQTDNIEVNILLQAMYARKDEEYAFEQDDNRIFEDSSFTQQYIQNQINQGKTYREAITHTNNLFGKVAKQIIIHYPAHFVHRYILPNTKEWLNALFMPHSLTVYVPLHITHIHTHARTYSSRYFWDSMHSFIKIITLVFAFLSTVSFIYKKQKSTLRTITVVWAFIAIYVGLNIILHPLEYRYIHVVIAGLQLISVCFIANYLQSRTKSG